MMFEDGHSQQHQPGQTFPAMLDSTSNNIWHLHLIAYIYIHIRLYYWYWYIILDYTTLHIFNIFLTLH